MADRSLKGRKPLVFDAAVARRALDTGSDASTLAEHLKNALAALEQRELPVRRQHVAMQMEPNEDKLDGPQLVLSAGMFEAVQPLAPAHLDQYPPQRLVECPAHRGNNRLNDRLFLLTQDKDGEVNCPACYGEEWSDYYEIAVNRIWNLLYDNDNQARSTRELLGRARVAAAIAESVLRHVGAGLPSGTDDDFEQLAEADLTSATVASARLSACPVAERAEVFYQLEIPVARYMPFDGGVVGADEDEDD